MRTILRLVISMTFLLLAGCTTYGVTTGLEGRSNLPFASGYARAQVRAGAGAYQVGYNGAGGYQDPGFVPEGTPYQQGYPEQYGGNSYHWPGSDNPDDPIARMRAQWGYVLCKAPDSETPQLVQIGRCSAINERYEQDHQRNYYFGDPSYRGW